MPSPRTLTQSESKQKLNLSQWLHSFDDIYIYIYIYVCVCVCVCVYSESQNWCNPLILQWFITETSAKAVIWNTSGKKCIIWSRDIKSMFSLNYVFRRSIDKIKENGFELTKERIRTYPAKTITDADYADDIAILANAPAQAETLLHSLERAATGIDPHVNAHKTEYMRFNQTGDISALGGSCLKLVDKFTYLVSSVSSTGKDIDTWLAHDTWMHYMKSDKMDGEKAWRQLHKNAVNNFKHVLEATPHKAAAVQPTTAHHENYQSLTNQICRILLEKQGRAHKWCSPVDHFTWPNKSRATSSNLHTAAL